MKLYPDDWKPKLTAGLISAACVIVAMMLVGANRFWPFILSIGVATLIGNLLGPLVCRRLFGSSSGNPLEKGKKKDEKS